MDLIYGTFNSAKLDSMRNLLRSLDIKIRGLRELKSCIEPASENFSNPLENAKSKADCYYSKLKRPLFSCDSGLYFDNIEPEDQPGVFVKRVKGKTLTNLEMVSYYSNLAKKYGGTLTAFYKNAIVLKLSEAEEYCYSGKDIWSEKFHIVSKPHKKYIEGFPLDTISVEISSGKYYYDLNSKDVNLGVDKGFLNFFKKYL